MNVEAQELKNPPTASVESNLQPAPTHPLKVLTDSPLVGH